MILLFLERTIVHPLSHTDTLGEFAEFIPREDSPVQWVLQVKHLFVDIGPRVPSADRRSTRPLVLPV